MDLNLFEIEKQLKESSQNSAENLIQYILFEIQSPIEDYFYAVELLTENYFKYKDIRIAILGSYLSSTWLFFKENIFLELLDKHLMETDEQNKAIIYYLHAYDIYIKCETKYPKKYSQYLQKSISYSKRFVYNYIRLAEITNRKESHKLLEQAISNIEKVWTEEELKNLPENFFLDYNNFINEFILGVDISIFEYKNLSKKVRKNHT